MGRHSSLTRVLRVTAWMRRFIVLCRTKRQDRPNIAGPLSLAEINEALLCLVKIVQAASFARDISAVRSGKPLTKSSRLYHLAPILDGALLRIGGRINRALTTFDARHQIILPQSHQLTLLIVADAHHKTGHAGQEHVLANLRERFWIVKARVVVRKLVRQCLPCRRRNAKPATQVMAPLPEVRLVTETNCFTHAAVDYFGPVYVKRSRSAES